MRRPSWCWLLVVLSLLRPMPSPSLGKGRPHPGARPVGRPPNIVLILSDDQAASTLGIDGDPSRATPQLDRLAREGVRFRRAYCNAPVCTASRQSLITGRLPHATRVTQLQTPLSADALTLADWLGDLDYRTAAFGKMHFNSELKHGFEELADTPDWFRDRRATWKPGDGRRRPWHPFHDPAAVWLNAAVAPTNILAAEEEASYLAIKADQFIRDHRNEPFFLVVSFHEPHAPFVFPKDRAGRFRPEQFDVPAVNERDRLEQPRIFREMSDDEFRGVQAAYYSSVAWMDEGVGRVLDSLRESGLEDDTIVVFASDNGYLLGEHGRLEKNCFFEPAVRVPLIVRWPGRLETDATRDDLVELVDLMPTVLDLAGLPQPPGLHGQSLVPVLDGRPNAKPRSVVVSVYPENEEAMARSSRFKLIMGSGHRQRRDGMESTIRPFEPYTRLYDLEADPGEEQDLARQPEMTPVIRGLRRELHRRLVSTREGLEPVPPWLDEVEAIHWCLIPTDERSFRIATGRSRVH